MFNFYTFLAGKTTAVLSILENKHQIMKNPFTKCILLHKNSHQPLYKKFRPHCAIIKSIDGENSELPLKWIKEQCEEGGDKTSHTLLILDDINFGDSNLLASQLVSIFTRMSHHSRMSVVLICHGVPSSSGGKAFNAFQTCLASSTNVFIGRALANIGCVKRIAQLLCVTDPCKILVDIYKHEILDGKKYKFLTICTEVNRDIPTHLVILTNFLPSERRGGVTNDVIYCYSDSPIPSRSLTKTPS